jgi:hypothetical protein
MVRGRRRESEQRRKFSAKRHRPLNPSFSPHAGRRSRERRRRASHDEPFSRRVRARAVLTRPDYGQRQETNCSPKTTGAERREALGRFRATQSASPPSALRARHPPSASLPRRREMRRGARLPALHRGAFFLLGAALAAVVGIVSRNTRRRARFRACGFGGGRCQWGKDIA